MFSNIFFVFGALYPADQQDAVRLTLSFESEPIVKLLQESAYRHPAALPKRNATGRIFKMQWRRILSLRLSHAGNFISRPQITRFAR
jgi:hypothetical protein